MSLFEQHMLNYMMEEEEKEDASLLLVQEEPSVTLIAELEMEEQESNYESYQDEWKENSYSKLGIDVNTYTFEKFKELALSLVEEKEAELARNSLLGSEKDINVEDSIECVPKMFLDEIKGECSNSSCGYEVVDSIRIMSVGELLSLMEI